MGAISQIEKLIKRWERWIAYPETNTSGKIIATISHSKTESLAELNVKSGSYITIKNISILIQPGSHYSARG